MQKLGKGAFGTVNVVKKKGSSQLLAMKTIKKEDLVKLHLIEASLLERNILLNNRHPFIVELKYSFQTEKKVYFIMEYIQGGELFNLLKTVGKFTESEGRFIFAQVVLGIQYLHNQLKIIYRDLKPENILMTLDGHVKITDFGLSKQVLNIEDKTFTYAGTPEYLAPEIILNKGHDQNVDL